MTSYFLCNINYRYVTIFFRLEIAVQNIQTNKDYNLVNVDIFG